MNYSKTFNVDFRKLALLLTPIFWRKVLYLDYVYSFIEPIKRLHYDFTNFRAASIYKIKHNGQVIILEKVLNDAFDAIPRRIYISDSSQNDPIYLYTTAENKPVYFGENYLYDFSAFQSVDTDFIVYFPVSMKPFNSFDLINFENKIKGLINYYKLASKRYVIRYI